MLRGRIVAFCTLFVIHSYLVISFSGGKVGPNGGKFPVLKRQEKHKKTIGELSEINCLKISISARLRIMIQSSAAPNSGVKL